MTKEDNSQGVPVDQQDREVPLVQALLVLQYLLVYQGFLSHHSFPTPHNMKLCLMEFFNELQIE